MDDASPEQRGLVLEYLQKNESLLKYTFIVREVLYAL